MNRRTFINRIASAILGTVAAVYCPIALKGEFDALEEMEWTMQRITIPLNKLEAYMLSRPIVECLTP